MSARIAKARLKEVEPGPASPTCLGDSPSGLGYALPRRKEADPSLPGPRDTESNRTTDRQKDRERSWAPTDTRRPGEYDTVLHAESAVGERRKPEVQGLRRFAPRQEERA